MRKFLDPADQSLYARIRRQLINLPWLDEFFFAIPQLMEDWEELKNFKNPDPIQSPLEYAQYIECRQKVVRSALTALASGVAITGLGVFLFFFLTTNPLGWGTLGVVAAVGLTIKLPQLVNKVTKWVQNLRNEYSSRVKFASIDRLEKIIKKLGLAKEGELTQKISELRQNRTAADNKNSYEEKELDRIKRDYNLSDEDKNSLKQLFSPDQKLAIPPAIKTKLGMFSRWTLSRALKKARKIPKNIEQEANVLTEAEVNALCADVKDDNKRKALRHQLGFTQEKIAPLRDALDAYTASLEDLRVLSGSTDPLANQNISIHRKKTSNRVLGGTLGLLLGAGYFAAVAFAGLPFYGIALGLEQLVVQIVFTVIGGLIGARIGEDISRSFDKFQGVDYNYRMQGITKVNSSGRWKLIRLARELVIAPIVAVITFIPLEILWPGAGLLLAFAVAGGTQARAMAGNKHFKPTPANGFEQELNDVSDKRFQHFSLKKDWNAHELENATRFWLEYRQKNLTKLEHLKLSDAIAHRIYYNIRRPMEVTMQKFPSKLINPVTLYLPMTGYGLVKTLWDGFLLLPVVSKIHTLVNPSLDPDKNKSWFSLGNNSFAEQRLRYLRKVDLAERSLADISEYKRNNTDKQKAPESSLSGIEKLTQPLNDYLTKKNAKKDAAYQSAQAKTQADSSTVAPLPEDPSQKPTFGHGPKFTKYRDKNPLDEPSEALSALLATPG